MICWALNVLVGMGRAAKAPGVFGEGREAREVEKRAQVAGGGFERGYREPYRLNDDGVIKTCPDGARPRHQSVQTSGCVSVNVCLRLGLPSASGHVQVRVCPWKRVCVRVCVLFASKEQAPALPDSLFHLSLP